MQFSTTHAGLNTGYCTAINASTDSLTLSGLTVVAGKIYKAFFTKFILNLPVEVEAQTTYYLRLSSSVIKIYTTLANAQAQTSPINFATSASGTLFLVYFPEQTYPALTCWEIGAETIADIVCCPPVPEVFTDCPNQATVSYLGGSKTLEMYHSVNYGGALNTNFFLIGQYTSGGVTLDLYAQIAFYFKDYTDGTVYPKPTAVITFVSKFGPLWYEGFAGNATYTTTDDFSSSMVLDFEKSSLSSNQAAFIELGYLPSSLTFNFSGSILPPPQIKVVMPDAFFENKKKIIGQTLKNNPINIGKIEEVLTYDPDTLTYWSDLLTYAGIKGRLHFSIPNFYPLTSSGKKFIDYSYHYQRFPDEMLNTWSNNEFTFYNTLILNRPGYDTYYPSTQNFITLFTASDFYNGYPNEDSTTLPLYLRQSINQVKSYPTGLPLGTPWFHTSVVRNADPNDPFVLGLSSDYVVRKPSLIAIAFTKWASGKYNKSNLLGSELPLPSGTESPNFNHYKQCAYFVQSVHPKAYVTSLGL